MSNLWEYATHHAYGLMPITWIMIHAGPIIDDELHHPQPIHYSRKTQCNYVSEFHARSTYLYAAAGDIAVYKHTCAWECKS